MLFGVGGVLAPCFPGLEEATEPRLGRFSMSDMFGRGDGCYGVVELFSCGELGVYVEIGGREGVGMEWLVLRVDRMRGRRSLSS